MKTELSDRTLWFDGDSSYNAEQMANLILKTGSVDDLGEKLISKNNEEIKFFSLLSGISFKEKRKLNELNKEWEIPEIYFDINIKDYLLKKLEDISIEHKYSQEQIKERVARIKKELTLFKNHDLNGLLLTAIYIVDVFNKNNIVWGTGRGSSCASYILYLIGLHDVDSVEFEIDYLEFFKNEGYNNE